MKDRGEEMSQLVFSPNLPHITIYNIPKHADLGIDGYHALGPNNSIGTTVEFWRNCQQFSSAISSSKYEKRREGAKSRTDTL